jgi:ABC-type phosphate/phosphonate transport system substrate-binding protein
MSALKNPPTSSFLRVGAVAYDAKVVTIWEGFKSYFHARGVEMDYVLYSNYDAQVAGLIAGAIDVAWNSPLAWVRSQLDTKGGCQALAMRDTDRDLASLILVRKNSGITSPGDLKNRIVAVGALDSPQATLIPLVLLAESGIEPEKDFTVLYHDIMVGKHGDHVGGEREAARALASGKADAACILDGNYLTFVNEGTLDPGTTLILAKTPPFDHCNFTGLATLPESRSGPFIKELLAMSFEDASVRPLMEMEGLRKWLPGRVSGYAQLENAVQRFHFYA